MQHNTYSLDELHAKNWQQLHGEAKRPWHRWHQVHDYDWYHTPLHYMDIFRRPKHQFHWWADWQVLPDHPLPFSGTAVLYSGGLESVLVGLQQTTPAHFFYMADAKAWHEDAGINLLEPALLMMVARRMGQLSPGTGGRIVVGLEGGVDRPECWGHSLPFLQSFSAKTQVELSLPLITFNKFELFRSAVGRGLQWCSCDFDRDWCGRCFKCWQTAIFYAAVGLQAPFKMYRTADMTRFANEYQTWQRTNVDAFGDMEHVYEAVKHSGLCMEELMERITWQPN